MESMDCDSDPDVASLDSPMQHSGWESCQRAVSYINTIPAFRKSPASTTMAYKPLVPQMVTMVTQDNYENQYQPNLQTPESNWSKCRNVFSAVNSFSGFRAQEVLSPKESEKSMEGFSDGDDDQVAMVTNSVPRFQDRCEIVSSVNPFSKGNISGSMTSFFEGLISKTSTDKSEPAMNTGIIDHGTSLSNKDNEKTYSSASLRLSKRHSLPFQSPARSSPKRQSLEPKSDRKGKHHSQPPPKMPRLTENVQGGHRSSPLRSLCKPPAAKQRKLTHHTAQTASDPPSKSHGVTFKSFIVFNIFVGVCLSVYALKVIQSTCSTFTDFDVNDLRTDLRSKVYGQHLVTEIIPDLINKYLTEMHQRSSQKPLVISLHGWTGVGKNYVSKIVSDFFPYTTVNKLLVPLHFAHSSQDDIYAQQIPEWIETNITRCYVNFVIFDEMDKASNGVLKGLNESVNMVVNQNATDRPVIFLLLSNSKGAEINKHVFQLLSDGRHRDHITIDDFSYVFQTEKPLWYTKLVPQKVIDVFVPFLPLERHHTVQCIKTDIVKKGLNVDKKAVSDVVQEMSFFKLNTGNEFSHTGCKRVSDKVDLIYSAFDENN